MQRDCATCGGTDKRPIYRQRFVMPAAHGFHAGYDVVICARCGFAFADNIPDQEFLDSYYRQMAKKTAMLNRSSGEEPEFLRRQQGRSADNIMARLAPGKRVLDVGCYTGSLLAALRKRGATDVRGLDPSASAAQLAKDKYGVDVTVGSLFDDLALGTFNFVVLSHVLEHIGDLNRALPRLAALLAPAGEIYVEVPDGHQFFMSADPNDGYSVEHHEPFLQFSVEHVNYFSTISLENLMTRAGFEKIYVEPQSAAPLTVLASVWRRAPVGVTGPPMKVDLDMGLKLERYIADSRAACAGLFAMLGELADAHREIYVWGAGLHTQKLLAQSRLDEVAIRAFIDSDPGYQGSVLSGRPIVAPDALKALPPLPILISSQMHQDDIERQIRKSGLANEILLMYPRASSG
jgi:SAM-dependent methyltransferase